MDAKLFLFVVSPASDFVKNLEKYRAFPTI
jgi:hypothetical protein